MIIWVHGLCFVSKPIEFYEKKHLKGLLMFFFISLDHSGYVSPNQNIKKWWSFSNRQLFTMVYEDRQSLSIVYVEPIMVTICIPITRNYKSREVFRTVTSSNNQQNRLSFVVFEVNTVAIVSVRLQHKGKNSSICTFNH